MKRFSVFLAPLILTFTTLACGSAVSAPEAPALSTQPVSAQLTATPFLSTSTPSPAVIETRLLTLEYPPRMRAGVESEVVTLTLAVNQNGGITPTAEIDGNVISGAIIEIPDLYATHSVTAEASLNIAGLQISPNGAIFEPLLPGQSAKFYWSVRPLDAGEYKGTLWLHLNFEDKATGEKSRIAISAQSVEIEAVDFFGLSVNLARTSGVVGSIVGGILGFPFLEDAVKFLLKKRRAAKAA